MKKAYERQPRQSGNLQGMQQNVQDGQAAACSYQGARLKGRVILSKILSKA